MLPKGEAAGPELEPGSGGGGRKPGGPRGGLSLCVFPITWGPEPVCGKTDFRRRGWRKRERQITGRSCAAGGRSSQGPALIRAAERGSRCQGGRPGTGEVPSPARPPSGGSRSRPRLRAPRTARLPGAPAPHAAPPNDRVPRAPHTPGARPGPASPRATSSGPQQESNGPASREGHRVCFAHCTCSLPGPHLLGPALQSGVWGGAPAWA